MPAHPVQRVRYLSPFGTPEWLTPDVAERRLVADQAWYERALNDGQLTKRQRLHGPPKIDQPNESNEGTHR
jgi:hypothetical protein